MNCFHNEKKINDIHLGGTQVNERAWLAAGSLPPGGLRARLLVLVHPQHLPQWLVGISELIQPDSR